jgi:hypothetical protein
MCQVKEVNTSAPKDKEKGKEAHDARYNLDTDSEVKGLIHQDAEVSPTPKWISDSGACTHMMQDTVRCQDIQPIRSEVRVGNGMGITIYRISTLCLFLF